MLVIDQPQVDFKSLFLKYSKTPQGIYIFDGFSASVGVLPYMVEQDGKKLAVGVLTSEEELFNPDSLNTLIGSAVVLEHPENFNAEISNMGGIVLQASPDFRDTNDPYSDSYSHGSGVLGLGLKVAIWDENLLNYIAEGNYELSAGYTANIVQKDGTWHGSPYSYTKTDIKYNHLAVVALGTARNGNNSALMSDCSYKIFQIYKDKKIKITDAYTTEIKPNQPDLEIVEKSNDSIDNNVTTTEELIIMKPYALPNGKVIQLSDEDHATLSDTLNLIVSEKQKLEDSNRESKQSLEKATTELTDSKTKTTELSKKVEESSKVFARSVAIAAKAEKFGVKVDYENFDPIETMRKALKDEHKDIAKVGEEVVKYLFDNAEIEEPESTEDPEEKPKPKDSTQEEVKDSLTSTVKRNVRNEKSTEDFTSDSMAVELAKIRKARSAK